LVLVGYGVILPQDLHWIGSKFSEITKPISEGWDKYVNLARKYNEMKENR